MIKVYGLKISYFTGKLETYLRYKRIPYDYVSMTSQIFSKTVREKTGAMQMPAVELEDGRWMTDTSPMIDWFEGEYPDHPILPGDPVQAFICRLIEDYADEWLWRSAMHYRWSYPESAILLARQITAEMAVDVRAPQWLVRKRVRRRQFHNYVERDGVTDANRTHVEQGYRTILDHMSAILDTRPYLFGERPTLADIGLSGPMLRHYSMDPTPAKIMRETAPAVMEWLYRLWNARADRVNGPLVDGISDDLLPLLREIGETHLEALCANAIAWAAGDERHGMTIQDAPYRDLQTSQYRVWCLEQLQNQRTAIGEAERAVLDEILSQAGCLEPMLRIAEPNSGYNLDGTVPFGTQSARVFPKVRD